MPTSEALVEVHNLEDQAWALAAPEAAYQGPIEHQLAFEGCLASASASEELEDQEDQALAGEKEGQLV